MMNDDELRPAPPMVQLERLRAVDYGPDGPVDYAPSGASDAFLVLTQAYWRMRGVGATRC